MCDIKYFGDLEKFNKKVGGPYEIGVITTEMLKCIPDLNQRCIKLLQDKVPTFACVHRKTQNLGTTK